MDTAKRRERLRYQSRYAGKKRNYRRQVALATLGGKCERCGSTVGLTFARRNPESISTLRRLWTARQEDFEAELKESILLCHQCFWDRLRNLPTYKKFTHGKAYGYLSRGCRCDLCTAAYEEHRIRRNLVAVKRKRERKKALAGA